MAADPLKEQLEAWGRATATRFAVNDADRPRDLPQARVDIGIPDELTWVERAYIQLRRQHPLRALCFHEEFCTPGSQDAKAARVQKAYGGRLSKWQYRRELQRAIDWVQGSRAA
jgi:hypothetical protein